MSSEFDEPSATIPASRQWWRGRARNRLPKAVLDHAQRRQATPESDAIHRFDALSRFKVGLLFAGFFATLWLYERLGEGRVVAVLCVAAVGLFFVPYTRIFMHSQMHWTMGGSRITRFVLDRFVSLLFSVPQTGYAVGHRMHHRYDNDCDPSGRPRDLQSTYMFSRTSRPTSIFLWVPYYMFGFQHAVVPWLVFTKAKKAERVWYVVELAGIVAFHAALFTYHASFYRYVYVPGLLLAWMASAVVLYMMHAVDASTYATHPTNTSTSRFFNWFGDNDGYHLEHTLFASVHPMYLPELHDLLALDPKQVLQDHYFIAGVKRAFASPARRDPAWAARVQED
jgi:fatty acid desaturase